MKKRKIRALLTDAVGLIEVVRCPNNACNNAGVLTNALADVEQCQWCWERDRLLEAAREVRE